MRCRKDFAKAKMERALKGPEGQHSQYMIESKAPEGRKRISPTHI